MRGTSGTTIPQWVQKCKRHMATLWRRGIDLAEELVGEWGLFAIVGLVAVAAFGLGRLSALEEVHPVVSVAQAPAAERPHPITPGGLLVASRTGEVYYYPWCGGASNIAPANQVWFKTAEAAERAGYRPAKNCKGLK